MTGWALFLIKPMVFHFFLIDQPGRAKPAAGQPASHVDPEIWLGWAGPGNLSHMAVLFKKQWIFNTFASPAGQVSLSHMAILLERYWVFNTFAPPAGQVSMWTSCFLHMRRYMRRIYYGISHTFPGDMRRYMRRIYMRRFMIP